MDSGKAILVDVMNFLPLVEARIMGKGTDLSDTLEITSLRQSLDMLDKMVKKCEKVRSVEGIADISKRIVVARETVDILATRSAPSASQAEFRDLAYLPEHYNARATADVTYARCLNMTNEEFDSLIEEWADDSATPGPGAKAKKKAKATGGSTQDKIRSDLVKLADTMKSKALWYRDLLVKDNEALSKYTVEQEKQLDTVAHVATEASKLAKTTRLSLRQTLFMIASVVFLVMLMMMIFIIT